MTTLFLERWLWYCTVHFIPLPEMQMEVAIRNYISEFVIIQMSSGMTSQFRFINCMDASVWIVTNISITIVSFAPSICNLKDVRLQFAKAVWIMASFNVGIVRHHKLQRNGEKYFPYRNHNFIFTSINCKVYRLYQTNIWK